MTAVVMLAGSQVIPGWAVMLGVMVAAALGAIAQWLASARTKKQLAVRVGSVVAGVAMAAMMWDCGWLPDWICFALA